MTIQEIQNDLINNKIDYSDAFERIKALHKPWLTKEWKLKRDSLVKKQCEQCVALDKTFVAQHLRHPEKFSSIKKRILDNWLDNYIANNLASINEIKNVEIENFKIENSEQRKACPRCKRLAIRERKTMKPKYSCDKCRFSFDMPITVGWIEKLKSTASDDRINEYLIFLKKNKVRSEIRIQFDEEIGKSALLNSIELHLKYISLEGIVTFCKTCAYRMDERDELLCWSCKTNYFNYFLHDNCYNCNQENKSLPNPFQQRIFEL